jgi:hypothetical protein
MTRTPLHIGIVACSAEVVADVASRLGFRRLGLTGTRWLVGSDVYPEALARAIGSA